MKRHGRKTPRFRFILNPYADARFTRCPRCEGKTKARKLPLMIHVEPLHPIVLNKTCRFCPYCDLLIAHRDEIEMLLVLLFEARGMPEVIGNDYMVVGTVDRADWRRGVKEPPVVGDFLDLLHEFKEHLTIEPAD